MEDSRMFAAQCWCDEETKHKEMDVVLAEAVARRIAVWIQSSSCAMNGMELYRDLLDKCAAHIGVEAYTSDDGSVQDEPVRLKVPELVAALVSANVELTGTP